MVELLDLKCPRCGAALQYKSDREMAVCQYCDAEVLVVDKARASSEGPGDLAEIEKKKLALEIKRQELAKIQHEATLIRSQIVAIEMTGKGRMTPVAVTIIIFLVVMVAIVAMLFPLFYVLQLYSVYGFTQTSCMLFGIAIIITGLVGIATTKLLSDRSLDIKRYEALQSPGYHELLARYQKLEPEVQKAREEVERTEEELKALV